MMGACKSSTFSGSGSSKKPQQTVETNADHLNNNMNQGASPVGCTPTVAFAGLNQGDPAVSIRPLKFQISQSESTFAISGSVNGLQGTSCWRIVSNESEGSTDGLLKVEGTSFDQVLPLFCGQQLVQIIFPGLNAPTVATYEVNRLSCQKGGLRITLQWEVGVSDLEIHLIRDGGRINNTFSEAAKNDCTWTSCIETQIDWGQTGDRSDDPKKDIDDVGDSGLENIYLEKPESKLYHVLVEYWGYGEKSHPVLTINIGSETKKFSPLNLTPQQVWYVGTIDWASRSFHPLNKVADCADDWAGGCKKDWPKFFP